MARRFQTAPGRQIRADQRGVALIEFALTLPFLLLLLLVGLELTNFVIAHHRVRQLAAMTADNASRVRTQMSEAYINQLFVGVQKAGSSMQFQNRGRLILSSVQNNAGNSGQWIRWQRCFGQHSRVSKYGVQGKGQNDSTLPTINGLTAQPSSAMMYAEVEYLYEPIFASSAMKDRAITHEVAFIVRQRNDFSIGGSNPATC